MFRYLLNHGTEEQKKIAMEVLKYQYRVRFARTCSAEVRLT